MNAIRDRAATPFLFGDDLRPSEAARRASADLGRIAEERRLGAIEAEAFARGREAGLAEARAEAEGLRAAALDRIAGAASRALASMDASAAAIEEEALAFFGELARALAGRAVAEAPVAGILEAAREAFRHLRGVPHLVARVNAALVEDADEALRGLAREHGFEGRIVVIGSEDIQAGDARLDWADGAVLADRRAREAAIEKLLAAARGDATAGGDMESMIS